MPSPLPNRLPFQETVAKDHKGCPSRDRTPRQERQAVLGRNLLDHVQLHHQPELVPGPASSVVVLRLLLGQLQCQVEPWGLAQTPQEPPPPRKPGAARAKWEGSQAHPTSARTLLLSII